MAAKSLPICIHAIKIYIKGIYVVLVIKVHNRFLTFVNLYVPPPFSLSNLNDMLLAVYELAEGNIFILGDLNAVADPTLDRLSVPPGTPGQMDVR